MPFATQIQNVSFQPIDIPLIEPFAISGGAQEVARNVLVTVRLVDGTLGYGEAAPFAAYNGETREGALGELAAARRGLVGANAENWRALSAELRAGGVHGSALCALESAILDALTRSRGLSLASFFGGARAQLETDMTVTAGDAGHAAAAATSIVARGIRRIKIKVGREGAAGDAARVVAVAQAAPGAALTLDANGAYSAAEAVDLVDRMDAQGVRPEFFEQPVGAGDWEGLAEVSAASKIPVAADEAARSAADVLRLARETGVQIVNLKLMKCGIVEALDMAAVARAAGLRLMIGGNVESILAMTVSACFASGLGGFSYADLDTPLFMADNPFQGGFVLNGGMLRLEHILAGHGVEPLATGVRRL